MAKKLGKIEQKKDKDGSVLAQDMEKVAIHKDESGRDDEAEPPAPRL